MYRTRTNARLLGAIVVLGVALAGCSADDAGESTMVDSTGEEPMVDPAIGGTGEAAPAGAGMGAEGQADDGDGGADQDPAAPIGPSDAAAGRDLVFRAAITLSSDDPDVTAAQVRERAADAGGFVSSTQLQRDDLGLLAGSITIRVPADRLDQLLAEVSETAASVVAETRSAEDVTGQLVDMDAQLRNLAALEEELLAILADARETGDVDEVIEVFDRVTEVRGQVESMEGRRAALADQVALSTLTVQVEPSRSAITERQQVPEEDLPLPWSPANEASTAWDQTVAALRSVVDGVIWIGVYVLPLALVWAVPVGLVLVVVRWWRRRNDGPDRRGPVDASTGTP